MNPTTHSAHGGRSWRTALILGPCLALLFLIGCVTGSNQPHMEVALNHLQSARTELQSAVANKGGHRVKAIGLVDEAIAEVQAGIEYAAARN